LDTNAKQTRDRAEAIFNKKEERLRSITLGLLTVIGATFRSLP
jgi:hypothetical protein